MANGYYGVANGDGNELGTGIQDFASANRVASNYIADNRNDVCEIYVGGGVTMEGDEPGDEWLVSLVSDGYGKPVSYVDEHGVKRVWDSVANHFTTWGA
jgi:hypothetical protein